MLTSLYVLLLLPLASYMNSRTEPVCTNAQPALQSLNTVMPAHTLFQESLNARLVQRTTIFPRQRPRVLNVETTSSKLLTLETTRFVLNVRTMLLSVSTNASLTTRENLLPLDVSTLQTPSLQTENAHVLLQPNT